MSWERIGQLFLEVLGLLSLLWLGAVFLYALAMPDEAWTRDKWLAHLEAQKVSREER